MTTRSLLLLLLAAASAAAQPLSVGLKVGVPLTDFVETARSGEFSYFTHTKRYIVGPQVELRLPLGFGIEFDALYRRMNYTGSGRLGGVDTTLATTANAWEFPLLVKYRFPTPIVRPFVTAGAAWNTLTGVKNTVNRLSPINVGDVNPVELDKTTQGYVFGFGVDIKVVVRLQPEFRYTRWGAKHFFDPIGSLKSNQNQGEFLLGITF